LGAAVAALALAGAGLVLLSTAKYGAGIASTDAFGYLDVARNLASGKGLVFHTGDPLVWWPPLYPMLLALIGSAARLDPAALAHLANAALFALVICLSARLLLTGIRPTTTYNILGICAVLFSIPLSRIYAQILSEVLFIPLLLLYLVFAQSYRNSGSIPVLAVMTLSTALACLTRYIGVAMVPAGIMTILLATGVNHRTRVVHAIAFAALSLSPLVLWGVRNYRLAETFFGNRGSLAPTYTHNLVECAKTMFLWFVPGRGAKYVALAGTAVGLVTFVWSSGARRRIRRSLEAILSDHQPVVMLLAFYTIMLSTAAMRDAYTDSRMLSPLYVPLLLVLLKLGSHLISPIERPAATFVSRGPAVLLALWLCFPFASVARSTAVRFRDGAGGYSTTKWRESETIAYARQVLSTHGDFHIYSNGHDVLWALAGVNATESPDTVSVSLTDLKGHWPAENGSIIVWFSGLAHRKYLFSIEELEQIADITGVTYLSDGTIYRVSARQTTRHDLAKWEAPIRVSPARESDR
jgi:hypothetical protein